MKIGGVAPTDPGELTFLGLDTRTTRKRVPDTTEYDGADVGKTAHYRTCWVNTKGVQGPWSETVNATVVVAQRGLHALHDQRNTVQLLSWKYKPHLHRQQR